VLANFRRKPSSRQSKAHSANRVTVFVRLWSGNTGDGDREIGRRMQQGAFRHGSSDLGAHGPLLAQQLGRDAQYIGLLLLGIGHEAAVEMLAGARHVRQSKAKQPGRAGFGHHERKILMQHEANELLGCRSHIVIHVWLSEEARRPCQAFMILYPTYRYLQREPWYWMYSAPHSMVRIGSEGLRPGKPGP
jgi:hypothetical protein